MSRVRVADYIARRLEQQGVTRVFFLAGGGMMHLQDAVSRSETIRYVCSHHEQSCAFAAEAHARAAGFVSVDVHPDLTGRRRCLVARVAG